MAIAALLAWIFNLRRLHAISEIPVSNIASAAQGYVELSGKAQSLLPLKSPQRGIDCVWYRLWIYVRDSNGLWRLAQYQASHHKFGLQDSSGYCEIDPEDAEIIASDRHTLIKHDHKYIEDVLRTGRQLYVLGELDSGNAAPSARQIQKETGELVIAWKNQPAKTLLRFDSNRDGKIDLQEWEHARQQAFDEIQSRHETLAKNLVPLITKPKNQRLFLISGISPHELRARFRFWSILHFIFLGLAVVMTAMLTTSHFL